MNSSVIRAAEVYREAVIQSATSIIIAHNHPSGDVHPSPEDIRVTKDLADAGKLLGIDLMDHLIIGHGDAFYSLKDGNHF